MWHTLRGYFAKQVRGETPVECLKAYGLRSKELVDVIQL